MCLSHSLSEPPFLEMSLSHLFPLCMPSLFFLSRSLLQVSISLPHVFLCLSVSLS